MRFLMGVMGCSGLKLLRDADGPSKATYSGVQSIIVKAASHLKVTQAVPVSDLIEELQPVTESTDELPAATNWSGRAVAASPARSFDKGATQSRLVICIVGPTCLEIRQDLGETAVHFKLRRIY